MATYAIGDVQGCYDELLQLLDLICFKPQHDRLWFTGDLVNRGPFSVEVLRFVQSLGERAVVVLGNHDLHLLAAAYGYAPVLPLDSFMDVLAAADRDELLNWLRSRPLLHHDPVLGYTLIHAGLAPQWDYAAAARCAAEAEQVLQGDEAQRFFAHMYGNQPDVWREDLQGWDRLRLIVNCFTRVRYCYSDGRVALSYKGAPGTQPRELLPWFQMPGRASAGLKIIFGHWSTLGRYQGDGVYGLDSGCVWGGALTALRLDDENWYSVRCAGACAPGED